MVFKKFSAIRLLSIVLAALMVFSFAGCGSSQTDTNTSSANSSVQAAGSTAASTGFSWEMAKGSKIKVMLSQHTYSEALVKKIPDFEAKTGIKVEYSITPEENYFDKVTTSLNSKSGDPDIFMTGAYQVWEYASAGYMQSLDEFINDKSKTAEDYNFGDFYPGIVNALKWDLQPGHKTGSGSQWALPMGFEQYALAYNKRIFKEKGLQPPKTMDDLLTLCQKLNEFNGKGSYALALRGTRNWATIHPGYMTTYVNYGAKDFEAENGKLVSKVNSKEAVDMTDMWAKLIKAGGSPTWSSYTWYQAGADLGAGKAAMLFDADIVEYFQNPDGASKEAGNLAWVPAPLPQGQTKVNSNLWTWALSMNKYSKNQLAAWLFLQYFTGKEYQLWAATQASVVNPCRKSVFEDPEFTKIIGKADGYVDTFKKTIDGSTVQFTPQPHFFETTTEWAATLQDIVGGKYKSTQEAMDTLKQKMDKIVSDVEVK